MAHDQSSLFDDSAHPDRLMTAREAAERLGMSERGFEGYCRRFNMLSRVIGLRGGVLFRRAEVEALARNRADASERGA